jgi:hypothetical protein
VKTKLKKKTLRESKKINWRVKLKNKLQQNKIKIKRMRAKLKKENINFD